jgi:hypothetical protein
MGSDVVISLHATVREVAKKAANPSENLLPRKVSRFVDKLGPPLPEKPVRPKLGLSKGYGWYQSSTAGISTPRKLLPTELSPGGSRSQMMPGRDSTAKVPYVSMFDFISPILFSRLFLGCSKEQPETVKDSTWRTVTT